MAADGADLPDVRRFRREGIGRLPVDLSRSSAAFLWQGRPKEDANLLASPEDLTQYRLNPRAEEHPPADGPQREKELFLGRSFAQQARQVAPALFQRVAVRHSPGHRLPRLPTPDSLVALTPSAAGNRISSW